MSAWRIQIAKPDIGSEEIEAVTRVLRSGRLACGPEVEAFEEAFASYIGRRHAVAVSSGTMGLEIALDLLGEREMSMPALSFPATWNAMLRSGVKPFAVDVGADGIAHDLPFPAVGVDLFGRVAGPCVVEDACEALGCPGAGHQGIAAVFGFYPNKQITTGEGGMIVCDDAHLAARFRDARNHGRAQVCGVVPTNGRMDEMSAALGRVQLRRLPGFVSRRAEIAARCRQRIGEYVGMLDHSVTRSWFVFPVFVSHAQSLVEHLVNDRIEAHTMASRFPVWPGLGDYPMAREFTEHGVLLPIHTGMTNADVDTVAQAVMDWRFARAQAEAWVEAWRAPLSPAPPP